MNQDRQAGDDDLLMRVLEGELSPESDEVKRRLATDPGFGQTIAELEGLHGALDAASETAREDMDGPANVDGPEAQRVRARIRELARESAATSGKVKAGSWADRPALGLPRWVLSVAAVLVVLFAVRARFSQSDSVPRERVTLGSSLGNLVPGGEVDRFGTFQWNFDDIGDGRFEVQVFESDTGDLVTIERGLKEARWKPDPEHTAAWPSKIRWTVSAYDASGSMLDSAEASAERSQR